MASEDTVDLTESVPCDRNVVGTVAELLGATYGKGLEEDTSRGGQNVLLHLASHLPEKFTSLSCPSLSLQQDKHCERNSREHHSGRQQAAEHAAVLLSRPLLVDLETEAAQKLNDISQGLLQNVYHSLAILVDSRIRAYATFLARHALSLADKDKEDHAVAVQKEELQFKVMRMIEMGYQIRPSMISTDFELGEDLANGSCFTLKASIDLAVPLSDGEAAEVLSAKLSAPGQIQAVQSKDGKALAVSIDQNQLLKSLMEQASSIVGSIVNLAGGHPEPKKEVTIAPRLVSRGLDMLCEAAAHVPVVSPDHKSKLSPSKNVPCLSLDDSVTVTDDSHSADEDDDEDVTNLSPDQCAHIVDDIFCVMDDAVLSRPQKRARKAI